MRSKLWDRDSVHNISGLRITHGFLSNISIAVTYEADTRFLYQRLI
jgi:hypothetical protein